MNSSNRSQTKAYILVRRLLITFFQETGAPGRSRTSDHMIRSHVLYPAELRAHILG